uniref:Uncharacterized protein n=1 Tax=Rhizophora mucronata TaxID=61149 RepID=A0A2P2P1Q0_RHIMU
MSNFVLSVLPAPLSPLTKIDWLIPSFIISLYAASATAKGCGLSSPKATPLYCAIIWLS